MENVNKFTVKNVQNMSFHFNSHNGNLISRSDSIKGLQESFGYDNLNRLKSSAYLSTT